MRLTLNEAATLLGRTARTVRAWLRSGKLKGEKHGTQWILSTDSLPLTPEQKVELQGRADALRSIVDDLVPSRLAGTRSDRRRRLVDLHVFGALRELHDGVANPSVEAPLREALLPAIERAAILIGQAHHEYEPRWKIRLLREARMVLSAAEASLLLRGPIGLGEVGEASLRNLDDHVLPEIGGISTADARGQIQTAGRCRMSVPTSGSALGS